MSKKANEGQDIQASESFEQMIAAYSKSFSYCYYILWQLTYRFSFSQIEKNTHLIFLNKWSKLHTFAQSLSLLF